jgi:catechol 2,3-dioxygenase-like lactoylglutathione lyase family enzyme
MGDKRYLLMVACLAAMTVSGAEVDCVGIGRVTVRVTEPERSVRFYRDVLGFETTPADSRFGRQCFWVNEDQSIEILQVPGKDSEQRLESFCLRTAVLEKSRAALERRHIPVTQISLGEDGARRCVLSDPDGHRIYLTGAAASRPPAPSAGGPSGGPPVPNRLRHVGLMVLDLDAAVKFYSEELGLIPVIQESHNTRWADMYIQSRSGDYIQLLVPPTAQVPARWSREHFGLDVRDAHAAYAQLVGRGLPPREAFEPIVGYAGHLKMNLTDPDGTLVELMELGAPKASERRER